MDVMDTETVSWDSVSVIRDTMESSAPRVYVLSSVVVRENTVMENVCVDQAGRGRSATSATRNVRFLTVVAMDIVRMASVSV